MKRNIFINEESFGQRNLLTVTGRLEVEASKAGNYITSELFFISFVNAYDRSSTVTMRVKGIDIYNLSSALLEVLQTGQSEYRKFTDSSKSKESSSSSKKFISLKSDESNRVYINLVMDSKANEGYKIVSSVQFERYEVKGVIKTLEALMSDFKQSYYRCQRAYNKINEKNKKETTSETY